MTQMTSEVSGSVCACVSLFEAHSQSQCGFDLYKQQTTHTRTYTHARTHTQHPHSRRTSQVYQRTKNNTQAKRKWKRAKGKTVWMRERKRKRERDSDRDVQWECETEQLTNTNNREKPYLIHSWFIWVAFRDLKCGSYFEGDWLSQGSEGMRPTKPSGNYFCGLWGEGVSLGEGST